MKGEIQTQAHGYTGLCEVRTRRTHRAFPSVSFHHPAELRYAAIYNGCDVKGLETCIDEGLWGHDLLDPSTIRVASLCTPVGTWARGEFHPQPQLEVTHLTSNEAQHPDTQQRLIYVGSLMRQNLVVCLYTVTGTRSLNSNNTTASEPWVPSDAEEIRYTTGIAEQVVSANR
jgi:hypothetical protein